jgi:hypothetical protein
MEITKLIDTGVLRTVLREVLPGDAVAQAHSATKIKGRGKTVLQAIDSVGSIIPDKSDRSAVSKTALF